MKDNSYREMSKHYAPWPQRSKDKAERQKRMSEWGRGKHHWFPHPGDATDGAGSRTGTSACSPNWPRSPVEGMQSKI